MCVNLSKFNIAEEIENRYCFANVINFIKICLDDADNLMKEN